MLRKKMLLNKRTVIVASASAAIPLAAVLIVIAARRAKRKSLQTSKFLRQTSSKTGVVITTAPGQHQQNDKSQLEAQFPSRDSETKATTTINTIAIKTTIADKDATNSAAIPSPLVPSTTSDSALAISPQTPKEEEISVSEEARKAGESLKELIITAIKEAKDSATETGKRLKEQTINIASTVDSKDIHSLGDNVSASVQLFEEVMAEIRKESYDEQIKLLDVYKDLLQTHIKVVEARGRMASKLKSGA